MPVREGVRGKPQTGKMSKPRQLRGEANWVGESVVMARATDELAAIMIADITGFSRLMERDESVTFARLRQLLAKK